MLCWLVMKTQPLQNKIITLTLAMHIPGRDAQRKFIFFAILDLELLCLVIRSRYLY